MIIPSCIFEFFQDSFLQINGLLKFGIRLKIQQDVERVQNTYVFGSVTLTTSKSLFESALDQDYLSTLIK